MGAQIQDTQTRRNPIVNFGIYQPLFVFINFDLQVSIIQVMYTICIQNSYRMYIQIIVCKMDPSFQNILTSIFCALPSLLIIGLFQKNKQTGGGAGWGDTILMPPRIFHFFTLTLHLEILDKTKHSTPGYYKIMLDPLEIRRPKTETPRNSTLFFLSRLWKFHFVFI